MSLVFPLVLAALFGLPLVVAIGAIAAVAALMPGLPSRWPAWVGVPAAVVGTSVLVPGVLGLAAIAASAFSGETGLFLKDMPTLLQLAALASGLNGSIAAMAYMGVGGAASFLPGMGDRAPWLRGSLLPATGMALAAGALFVTMVLVMRLLPQGH